MIHYTFKLTYNTGREPAVARVRLVEHATLFDLADTLTAAIGFDLDHAFGFHSDLKDPFAKNMECEYTLFADQDDARLTSDTGVENTKINEVFEEGDSMLFHFDYGDDWRFLIQCESIEMTRSTRKRPQILEVLGQFPEQYPDVEEEDDDAPRIGINLMTGERIELRKPN